MSVTIGNKIKKIRELNNYTQEYMAEKLGMTQSGYGKIERDETDVTYSKLEEIASVLKVSVEDLIAFDQQKFFNSFNNVKGNNVGSIYINEMAKEVKQLYEDKIELLGKLLQIKDEQLTRYQDKFGDI